VIFKITESKIQNKTQSS